MISNEVNEGEEREREGGGREGEELAFYSCRGRSIFAGRFVFVFCRLEPLEPTHCSRIQDGVHRHLCHRRQCCQQRTPPARTTTPPFRRPNAIQSTSTKGEVGGGSRGRKRVKEVEGGVQVKGLKREKRKGTAKGWRKTANYFTQDTRGSILLLVG